MCKIIVDENIIGRQFANVLLNKAETLAIEKEIQHKEILEKLIKATTSSEIKVITENHFGNELKIKFKE